jgi:hypothetical protein
MVSSCSRAAVLIGQDPSVIPAHPRYIRERLQRMRPAEHNISRKRLLNIKRGVWLSHGAVIPKAVTMIRLPLDPSD